MAERLAEMRAIGREALLVAQPEGILRFRATPETRQALEEIVAAEAECCPFLEFELIEDADALQLRVSAPDGAEPVVAGLTAAFSAP